MTAKARFCLRTIVVQLLTAVKSSGMESASVCAAPRGGLEWDLPVVMGRFDAHEFWNAVEIRDVAGCQGRAGDQVVQGPADVDHHFAGRGFLKAVVRQFGHQNFHHICGCQREPTERHYF